MEDPKPTDSPSTNAERFGQVAVRLGLITPEQLGIAVKEQSNSEKVGLRKRLGEVLVDKGFLTPDQLDIVIKNQTFRQKKKIGDYELISKLGEGGMGAVFKARQVAMDRLVALKVLSPLKARNQEFRDRFVREARSVAKLNHPHIVMGIDTGTADGYSFFAMEFIDGESLLHYLRRKGGKLHEKEALEFARQIGLALQHAHQFNMLHRDVKPDNILLDKSARHAKLADLGLARAADSDEGLTAIGQALGTPFYMSPEQARGQTLTTATDLYSLGGTLFHLLTGQVPYTAPNAPRIMARHITDPVPDPRKVNPDISDGAARIVMKLMQKKPEDRYASAADVIREIEKVLKGEPAEPEKARRAPIPRRPGRRGAAGTTATRNAPGTRGTKRAQKPANQTQNVVVLVVLVVILLVGLGILYSLVKKKNPPPPAQAAETSRP